LDVGEDVLLGFGAGMHHGPLLRRTDGLRITPKRAGLVVVDPRLPLLAPLGQLPLRQLDVQHALARVDHDDIAVLEQADRPADRSFGADMADAKAARTTGKTAVGDQRYFVAHAHAVEGRRGRQHLAHAWPALGAFVTDDQHFAFLEALVDHRVEAFFFAVEDVRRATEDLLLHAGDFHDRAF